MLFLDLDFTEKALRTLGAFLCRVIYQIVAFAYQLFMDISKFPYLISTHEIYKKIVMILTIVMVFYVTFEFVKYIVQPDTMTDKEKGAGNIVGRMVGVVLLLAFVPSIFSFAFKVQNVIIDSQIFSKVFLGKINYDSESLGKTFAYDVFSTFYYYDEDLWGENQECDGVPCQAIVNSNYSALSNTGKLPYLSIGLNESAKLEDIDTEVLPSSTEEPLIHFDAVFAVVVGGFLAYILILYCVDLGVRVAQMLYLQIIAPIPIMGFLIPKKDGIFQKWTKQCLTTYLDIFIRLSLIYFIILLSETLMASEVFDNFGATRGWVKVAIIMGLLLFAQKAPKMLEELFPKGGAASGNLGLKGKDRIAPTTARAIGAALGASKLGWTTARRIASNINQNRANGKKSRLTKEGREQYKNQAQNRRNARRAQQLYERDSELNTAEKNLRAARRRELAAKKNGASPEEQARLENERREAQKKFIKARDQYRNSASYKEDDIKFKNAGRKLSAANAELKAAQQSGDLNAIKAATLKQSHAQAEFDQIKNDFSTKYARNTKESRESQRAGMTKVDEAQSGFEKAQQSFAITEQNLATAEQNLATAEQSGNQREIEEAQKGLEEAQEAKTKAKNEMLQKEQAYESAKKSYFEDDASSEFREKQNQALKTAATTAQEQVIEDKNKSYKSMTSAVVGGVAGAAKIMAAGAKTTKPEEIFKNIKEADKKDIQHVKDVEKYYADGGTGFVDRTIQQMAKKSGMPTSYEQTVLQNRALEPAIKKLEAEVGMSKDVKTKADDLEDRLKDKLDDSKVLAVGGVIKTGLKNEKGEDIYVTTNGTETHADVYRRYKGYATSARAVSDNASKELQDFESQNQAILDTKGKNLADEQLANYQKIAEERERLQKEANKKAQEAANYEYAVTQVQKNAARQEITMILQDILAGKNPRNGVYDKPAIEKVDDALESIRLASQNPDIASYVKEKLSPEDYQAFITGKISSFDQLDNIKVAATNASNEYERRLKDKKEAKRSSESSNLTSAQKAANDYNGSGNK